jgi:NAD-dependent SIR2 family protein deacetylase
MNCHRQVKTDSAKLQLVRASFSSGKPIEWLRVHKVPDYAYFDHSVHLHAGVGCASCHGRVDQMEVVRQEEPLSMSWCLECHRDPGKHIRPDTVAVTQMDWISELSRNDQQQLIKERNLQPPEDCAACHR